MYITTGLNNATYMRLQLLRFLTQSPNLTEACDELTEGTRCTQLERLHTWIENCSTGFSKEPVMISS